MRRNTWFIWHELASFFSAVIPYLPARSVLLLQKRWKPRYRENVVVICMDGFIEWCTTPCAHNDRFHLLSHHILFSLQVGSRIHFTAELCVTYWIQPTHFSWLHKKWEIRGQKISTATMYTKAKIEAECASTCILSPFSQVNNVPRYYWLDYLTTFQICLDKLHCSLNPMFDLCLFIQMFPLMWMGI